MIKYHPEQQHMYRKILMDINHWTSSVNVFSSPLNSPYHCTGKCSHLDMTTSKIPWGLFGNFTPVPINPSAHSV